jgi:hypothetical protein
VARIKRGPPCQQLVQDDAERIHVALNGVALSAKLFRRGIRERQVPKRCAGVIRGLTVGVKLFSNAKIDEPTRLVGEAAWSTRE